MQDFEYGLITEAQRHMTAHELRTANLLAQLDEIRSREVATVPPAPQPTPQAKTEGPVITLPMKRAAVVLTGSTAFAGLISVVVNTTAALSSTQLLGAGAVLVVVALVSSATGEKKGAVSEGNPATQTPEDKTINITVNVGNGSYTINQ